MGMELSMKEKLILFGEKKWLMSSINCYRGAKCIKTEKILGFGREREMKLTL